MSTPNLFRYKNRWLTPAQMRAVRDGAKTIPIQLRDGTLVERGGKDVKLAEPKPLNLEEARAKFAEKEGRPVPNNKKNDLVWILSKI